MAWNIFNLFGNKTSEDNAPQEEKAPQEDTNSIELSPQEKWKQMYDGMLAKLQPKMPDALSPEKRNEYKFLSNSYGRMCEYATAKDADKLIPKGEENHGWVAPYFHTREGMHVFFLPEYVVVGTDNDNWTKKDFSTFQVSKQEEEGMLNGEYVIIQHLRLGTLEVEFDDDLDFDLSAFVSAYESLTTLQAQPAAPTKMENVVWDSLLKEAAACIIDSQTGSTTFLQRKFSIGYNRACRLMDQLEMIGIVGPASGSTPREVLIKDARRWGQLMNNNVSSEEHPTPEKPQTQKTKRTHQTKQATVVSSVTAEKRSPLEELDKLIGLASVKQEVKKLVNFVKVQQMREKNGLKASNLSYHCVFTGNPGTGKTTVARIVADIYKELGVISGGQLVETDRSGLVGGYVGQTAPKTNEVIDKALDGVLFIDEAYALVQSSGSNDYGNEAIATLLKRMEDDRKRLVVIVAGYTKEMEDFINANPGLQSRFTRYINFEDYSADELTQIFLLQAKNNDYIVSGDAVTAVKAFFQNRVEHKDRNFGNGREARNLFEKTIERQSCRIAEVENPTKEVLQTIEANDIVIP